MPRRRTARTTSSLIACALGCALLSACSAGLATPTPVASSSTLAFTALPASALRPVPPFSYGDSAVAEEALRSGEVGTVLSAFSGGVSRDLIIDGRVVGGVLLYRFAGDVAAAERVHFPPMIVYTFAGSPPHQGKVGGQVVQRVDRTSDGRTVIGWTHDDYVVVVWTNDRSVATRFVGDYVLRSM